MPGRSSSLSATTSTTTRTGAASSARSSPAAPGRMPMARSVVQPPDRVAAAHRVLLPGVGVLARQVSAARTAAEDRLHATVARATFRADPALPPALVGLLAVPTVSADRSWNGCGGRRRARRGRRWRRRWIGSTRSPGTGPDTGQRQQAAARQQPPRVRQRTTPPHETRQLSRQPPTTRRRPRLGHVSA